jgi:hypothetical protein
MSTRDNKSPRMIQNVFVLLLLAVFAAMSTLLVTLGAQVYRGTVERANANNEARILSAVVRSAVWAEDGLSQVMVEEIDGVKTLSILSTYDDESYVKRLYCHDGMLWESFTSAEYEFDLTDGESLCAARSFEPCIENGFLTVELAGKDGSRSTVQLQLRSTEVAR